MMALENRAKAEVVTRPLRFACTGGAAALVQLGILAALSASHWAPIAANALALLLSTQVNFVLSYLFTWGDRRSRSAPRRALLGRWAAYQGSTAGTAILNMGVFVLARVDLHTLAASALGTAVAALLNFFAGDRLVFRARGAGLTEPEGEAARGPVVTLVGSGEGPD